MQVAQGHQHQAPYRESKLTYLLQNAFGGNAQTAVVANLSPTFSSMQDSLSTLKIAQNAALVKNMVQPNTCSTGEKQALHAEIQRLRSQVSSVKVLACLFFAHVLHADEHSSLELTQPVHV